MKPSYPPSTADEAHTRYYSQTPLTLFRFSALTFNGHQIHYSVPWCQNVEGHRNLVVHGPLNMINLLDLWRDARDGRASGKEVGYSVPEKIVYRATRPLYANEQYRATLEPEEGEKTHAVIHSEEGALSMKADITAP
jgi:hydroxyacyl-ACP dehydratase HTD2-like protein with hotdog domain